MKKNRISFLIIILSIFILLLTVCSKKQPLEPTMNRQDVLHLTADIFGNNEHNSKNTLDIKSLRKPNTSWNTTATISGLDGAAYNNSICFSTYGSASAGGQYPGAEYVLATVYTFLYKWDGSRFAYYAADYSNVTYDYTPPSFNARSSSYSNSFDNLPVGTYKLMGRATAIFNDGTDWIEKTRKFVYIYDDAIIEVQ